MTIRTVYFDLCISELLLKQQTQGTPIERKQDITSARGFLSALHNSLEAFACFQTKDTAIEQLKKVLELLNDDKDVDLTPALREPIKL